MVIAVHKLSYDNVQNTGEYNNSVCYMAPTKAALREALERDKQKLCDYVFFTDKTRAK